MGGVGGEGWLWEIFVGEVGGYFFLQFYSC